MRMNVAYSSSDAYANITYIAIMSLFESNKSADEINVYLIEEGMSQSAKDKMMLLADKYRRCIKLIPLDDVVGKYESILPSWGGSRNLCFKLFLSSCSAFDDVDKVLCMESDMIVCDDISEIFETDMTDVYVAGVGNPINCRKQPELYCDEYPMYLNGGLNYFNLALMRADNVQQKLIDFIINNSNCKATVLCERVYNIEFADRLKYLPIRYNVAPYMLYFSARTVAAFKNNPHSHSQEEINDAISLPAIIHYAGALQYVRPWFSNSNHPMKDVFLKYNNMSDWKMDVDRPFIKSKNQKKRDFKHFVLKILPLWAIKFISGRI